MSTHPQPTRDGLVDRAWQVATSPVAVGVLLAFAGGICVTVAVTGTETGWLEPLRPAFAIPAVAGLVGGAAVLACAAFWERWNDSRAATGSTGLKGRTIPGIGLVLVAAGAALLVGNWLAVLRARPAGEMILTQGETAEYFRGRVAGESVKIMLPERFRLDSVEFGDPPVFGVSLAEPGGDVHRRARLAPGQVQTVDGLRVAPIGLAADSSSLRATLSSTEDETISATVASGDTFRLRPDGAEYEVKNIVENYLGSLGPAVQLESSEHGEFWAFQRTDGPKSPEFVHGLRVERLEQAPGVVFSVSPSSPQWPAGTGGMLLLVGFAVVLLVPERIRLGPADDERAASFNDAGRLYAEIEGREEQQ